MRWHQSLRHVFGVLSVCAVMFSFVAGARAEPPPNLDPTLQHWFEGLHRPAGGISCCAAADCHVSESRMNTEGYEVYIEQTWVTVPTDSILQHVDNPTGHAVVCYRRIRGYDENGDAKPIDLKIFCFVRPSESSCSA